MLSLSTHHDQHWQLSLLDEQLLQLALREDLGTPFVDLTCKTLFTSGDYQTHAKVVSKHPVPFVFCGLLVVNALLHYFPETCVIKTDLQDGQPVEPGATILQLEGSAQTIMMLERTLLNFIQHLSAIATQTAKYVTCIQHTATKILDTRKTTPGFRHLDKYAVFCGGGVNHRFGLYDAILIKDNHIDALGGIAAAINLLPDSKKHPTVIEVRTLAELEIVLTHGITKIDRVLLDNMTNSELKTCVDLCKGKLATEASGNISLANIAAIAATGVNYASVGSITHSAEHIDLSLRL